MSENKGAATHELKDALDQIARDGIQADLQPLKKDMSTQFEKEEEWIREYVVNAYDAGAPYCRVSGREDELTTTIIVEDTGCGMNRQGVLDFNTIYRSAKDGDPNKIVGRHGVGKLSAAAITGQCGFLMETSTGKECWRMRAGRLLDEAPIQLERIEPVPPRGTRFEITFTKRAPLHEELRKLHDILKKYVCYLPMEIILTGALTDNPHDSYRLHRIREEWVSPLDRISTTYQFSLHGNKYEAVLSMGPEAHDVYQNRVFITGRYNLLSRDLSTPLNMPHLRIRIDSPDFELPFGRHCLQNEDDLRAVSEHLRSIILPQFLYDLWRSAEAMDCYYTRIEDMICTMIAHEKSSTSKFGRMPIFRVVNRPERKSLVDLRRAADATGKLYLENPDDAGCDYSQFDGLVLSQIQPEGGLAFLKTCFESRFINLSLSDIVLESMGTGSRKLGVRELDFQKHLGFNSQLLERSLASKSKTTESSMTRSIAKLTAQDLERMDSICEETKQSQEDLEKLEWRVNYLVQRDGKSPCLDRLFLLKNGTTVLNLHHPDIERLLIFSERAPSLAGHLALAMCLEEGKKILPHLTPEAREDLILLDAIARCGAPLAEQETVPDPQQGKPEVRSLRDFMRHIQDLNLVTD